MKNKNKFNKILIYYKSTISEVLTKINSNKLQFCFLIDDKKRVKAIITDGDIRRAILKKYDLEEKITKIANKNFKFLFEDEVFLNNKNKYLDKFDVKHLPILSKDRVLVDFISNVQKKTFYNYREIFVMILAGGYGKRLMPLTKYLPKPMVKLRNKPILEHLINKLEYFDLKNIIISTFYKSNEIKKYFRSGKKHKVNLNYTKETKPLGTAGPIKFLKKVNCNTFVIINSDVFTNVDIHKIINNHSKNNNDITILTAISKTHINFGVLKHKGSKVLKVIEKPVIESKILGGIYIINKKIVKLCTENHLDIDELINKAIEKNYKVSFYHEDKAYWFDLGSIDELEKVENLNLEMY